MNSIAILPETAVQVQQLVLKFNTNDGPVVALDGIDLTIEQGEFVSLIGPSGCGKTTLVRVLADLEKPTTGTVLVNGVAPEQARLQQSYGYVFQSPALLPWRTVKDNVILPLEIMGYPKFRQRELADKYLALVYLDEFKGKYPWQLSGGMQQRVSIARALSVEPQLLFMDEPFGALDEITRDHLNEQLRQLWRNTSKTVVFVTHSIPEAVFLSSRIVVMSPRPGRIIDIIDCDLPVDRSIDIRESQQFLEISHRVRQGLKAGHSYNDQSA